jgi:hypothetical protein
MKKGVFHKRLGNTSVAVDLCAIVQVGVLACKHQEAKGCKSSPACCIRQLWLTAQ